MPARAAAKKRTVVCAGPSCKVRFTPQRATAKYHAAACREAARRARAKKTTKPPAKKAAATEPAATEPARSKVSSAADRHTLVLTLRKELADADALDTFEGQLAIELAKRLVQADSPVSSLADKVRTARAAALAQAGVQTPAPAERPAEEDDEVTRARKQREEARQKAGLS